MMVPFISCRRNQGELNLKPPKKAIVDGTEDNFKKWKRKINKKGNY